LESKIRELERRLEEVSHESDAQKPKVESVSPAETSEELQTAPEPTETIAEDSEEETFTVTAPEEPMIQEQEALSESKKSHEKKKRKFF